MKESDRLRLSDTFYSGPNDSTMKSQIDYSMY